MTEQPDIFGGEPPLSRPEMVCSAVICGPNDCYRVELRRMWVARGLHRVPRDQQPILWKENA